MPRSLAFSSSNSALDNRPASFSLPSSHSASVSSMLNSSLDVFFSRECSASQKTCREKTRPESNVYSQRLLLESAPAPHEHATDHPLSLKEQPRLERSRLTAAWYAFRLRTDLRLRLRDSTRISRATGSALLLRVTEDLSRNRCDPHLPLQVNDQQQQGQAVAQAERIARRRREGRLQFSSMLTCGRRSSPCPVDQDLRKSSGSEQRQCTDTYRSHIHTLQHSPTK